eukprot:TRINITY_DN1664_c0_g1_i1.p1 TRINITY_DN1664_c0_g1~~TRINITY_DN1664_c0_g1_i1.p1  ORF type:complete len:850 (+),score=179.01 TRINITY_DN1664_c0_g1_i1:55-2604(+)
MAAPDEHEIQDFIEENNLGERAASMLRDVTPAIQRTVIEQGSLQSCRDPNAGCIGRIRKAQAAPRPISAPPSPEELEQFIDSNTLNERAAESMRRAPPQVQRQVIDQGGLLTCRDPSAGCIGRINRASLAQSYSTPQHEQKQLEPPTKEELDEFIEDNDLNERASEALRGSAPYVQRMVLDHGSLRGCRDQNAGCIGRIHRAQKASPAAVIQAHFEAPNDEEIADFILANELDTRASEALRGAAPGIQRQVLDQGSLRGCRDPNAGCIGRLHRAQTAAKEPPASYRASAAPHPDEIERFIRDEDLNERASEILRTAAPMVQRQVLDQGSLRGCRDTSAGCIGRVHKAQTAPRQDFGPSGQKGHRLHPRESRRNSWDSEPNYEQPRHFEPRRERHSRMYEPQHYDNHARADRIVEKRFSSFDGQGPSPDDLERFIVENFLDDRAAEALRDVPSEVQHLVLEQGGFEGCREPSAACLGRIRRAQTDAVRYRRAQTTCDDGFPTPDDVEQFCEENAVNERAAVALREVPWEIQKEVLEQGSLKGCRDASAGCIGRIAKAQKAAGQRNGQFAGYDAPSPQWHKADTATPEEVEAFIADNDLNERATDALRNVAPSIQRFVLDQGSLLGCREPSAGCIGRISKAQKSPEVAFASSQRTETAAPTTEEVHAFVQEYDLNERAASILLEVKPVVQRYVLDQGSLNGCRDVSAGCIGRVKKAQQLLKEGALSEQIGSSGGPRSQADWNGAGSRLHSLVDDVERFIERHTLSERAANALRQERPEVQGIVLQRGSLEGTRDMSASCMGRIRKANQDLTEQPAKRARYGEGHAWDYQGHRSAYERRGKGTGGMFGSMRR